jgi:hypothetical protein
MVRRIDHIDYSEMLSITHIVKLFSIFFFFMLLQLFVAVVFHQPFKKAHAVYRSSKVHFRSTSGFTCLLINCHRSCERVH